MELIKLDNMEIIDIDNSSDYSIFKNTILTIGAFDGVHLAHKTIIDIMNQEKIKHNMKSAVMTFDPHPDFVLNKRSDNGYITPINKKIELFKEFNVDYLIIIQNKKKTANMNYIDFYNKFLSNFAYFVIGYDFCFGYKAEGKASFLKEKKKNTIIVSEIDYENDKLSSSKVRELLKNVNVKEVIRVLGRPYEITGTVTTGAHIGSSLGFPTANIDLDNSYMDILDGVYFVRANYKNNSYYGICNIGHNPSINYVKNKRLEVNLFDFNINIYGELLEIEFLDYIRSEIKFDNKEDLIKQINCDKNRAIELIKELD